MRLPYRRWKALQRVRCLRMNDGNVAGIIRDTKAFLEKYFGLGIAEFRAEEQEQSVVYEIEPAYQMVAEENAQYGEKK